MSKILSVDDSATMRRIIGRAVAVLGFDFIEAENGVQAMELLPQHASDLDLIILDVNMPEMDGFETLSRIKADARFRDIPVMMVTTEADRSRVVQAIQAGAVNYVTKPFNQEDLGTKIAQCLGCF